jgi:tetratricopeptide (TPR) repeat protein
MKRTAHLLLLPLLALALSRPHAAAQSAVGPHMIKGTVYAEGGRPSNVEVVLENATRTPLARTLADEDGRYAFYGLGFGVYRVVVPAVGDYAAASQEVEISGSPDSVIIRTVDFTLVPRRGDPRSSSPPSAVFTQEVPRGAEEEYKKGVKALERGAGDEGVAHLKRAVEIFPDYYSALLRLGAEDARAGKYEQAVPLLRRACKVNPSSPASHVMLGMSLVELGQYAEAAPALELGKSLDPKSVNAHLYLGIAQSEAGDAARAEANLRRAYELGGAAHAAIAHLHLASLYDRQGKYQRAADELEAYLRDVPTAKNSAKIRQVIESLRRKGKGKK